jgi:hypothetical protein
MIAKYPQNENFLNKTDMLYLNNTKNSSLNPINIPAVKNKFDWKKFAVFI